MFPQFNLDLGLQGCSGGFWGPGRLVPNDIKLPVILSKENKINSVY